VCGASLADNRRLARAIELNANGSVVRHPPHAGSGPNALPHYQPDLIRGRRLGTRSMKPTTEKPNNPFMRFFTPELYVQGNSLDDDEADRADGEWEAAIQRYQAQLAGIRAKMPAQVKELAELCLHDAEFLALDRDQVEPPSSPTSLEQCAQLFGPPDHRPGRMALSVKHDDTIVCLIYGLWADPRTHQYAETWPFSKKRPVWLYDEIDIDSTSRGSLPSLGGPSTQTQFLHRILFSDGVILEVPFDSVMLHVVPVNTPDESPWSRRTA
jgi:hypothetical protein